MAGTPAVAELAELTLGLLRERPMISAAMREDIAGKRDLKPDDPEWPRFVNNHAWALVRLQAEGHVWKAESGHYAMRPSSRAVPPVKIVKGLLPEAPVECGKPLPTWADQMQRAKNKINALRWPDRCARLSDEDIFTLWKDCNGYCVLTGLQFTSDSYGGGAAKRAFGPSLDRIDPTEPYTLANCRFVLVTVNFALNAFGDEVFDRIVAARHKQIKRPLAAKRRR